MLLKLTPYSGVELYVESPIQENKWSLVSLTVYLQRQSLKNLNLRSNPFIYLHFCAKE